MIAPTTATAHRRESSFCGEAGLQRATDVSSSSSSIANYDADAKSFLQINSSHLSRLLGGGKRRRQQQQQPSSSKAKDTTNQMAAVAATTPPAGLSARRASVTSEEVEPLIQLDSSPKRRFRMRKNNRNNKKKESTKLRNQGHHSKSRPLQVNNNPPTESRSNQPNTTSPLNNCNMTNGDVTSLTLTMAASKNAQSAFKDDPWTTNRPSATARKT